MKVHELKRIWKVLKVVDTQAITSGGIQAVMVSKNGAADVFTVGFVVTRSFAKVSGGERGSVPFLVCTAEFIHMDHTKRSERIVPASHSTSVVLRVDHPNIL